MRRIILGLIAAGFALAIAAVARNSRVLAWIAIPVLAVGLAARFLARRRADRETESGADEDGGAQSHR
jgi:phosphate/sulfate permease